MLTIHHQLLPRDIYLSKLKSFQDCEPVKVVTGIRRCGKSSLLALMREHLLASGIAREQILSINFESIQYNTMSVADVCNFVHGHVLPGRRLYLFLDELQRLEGWENAVNSFRVDLDCDIYITGSNACLLSSEYSTYLAGRYVEIRMLPLSFREFLLFHGFTVKESRLGTGRHSVFTRDGEALTLEEAFSLYRRCGGMPGLIDSGLEQERSLILLEGLYNTVVFRDILRRPGEGQLRNPALLEKIILFLADNIGNTTSLRTICNTLASEDLMQARNKNGKPATQTVAAYVNALLQTYLFYEVKRFDLKGKELLRTLGKYYMVDMGLRNFLLGYRDTDTGHILENIVYFELLRRGYAVTIGKIGDKEIDFIAIRDREKIYYQVTMDMDDPKTRERELAPLRAVQDNYEKVVLTLRTLSTAPADGIKIVPLLDFLLQ